MWLIIRRGNTETDATLNYNFVSISACGQGTYSSQHVYNIIHPLLYYIFWNVVCCLYENVRSDKRMFARKTNKLVIPMLFHCPHKRIHRAHLRHNLLQATHCYVNIYHNGYTIYVLPYFLVHTYKYTHIHTHMYIHSHVSIYTYTHIYILKPEVFLANDNTVHKKGCKNIVHIWPGDIYFYHIFWKHVTESHRRTFVMCYRMAYK